MLLFVRALAAALSIIKTKKDLALLWPCSITEKIRSNPSVTTRLIHYYAIEGYRASLGH
jgi:hypothetical protein